MASRKEYEMLFQLNAQLGSSYNSTFKNAQGAITSMQKEIAALSKTQSDITAYQKQQSAIEASKKKLEVLQQQYDNIQKEMSETGQYSSILENKMLAKQQQIDKTTASISTQTSKLEQMGNALREAGVNTADLTSESAKLGTKIDAIKVKQEEAANEANNFGSKASAAFGAAGQALVAAGITVGLKKIAEAYGMAIEASMVFESAMTGIAKTTDMSDAELAAMGQEIKTMSTDIPIVTEELAGIGEVAGQLGIEKNNLMDFSEVMAKLATATTMTAEEGATMLAQFANITQMDPSYYSNLASAVVDLGNNFATTEQKIIDMSQGIAASASLAGMSESDMLGLSAAVTSLGIEVEAGSTSMSKLISDIMKAVETGDNLNEFASISNMSAEEFKTAWGNDAVSALQAFVLGLSDTARNGKSATVALTELGITETRMQRMILSLSNSGDLLNRTLDTSARGWAENTALTAEANKRYATTQSRLTMMQNSYNNLRIAIGDALNPTLGNLYKVMTDVLSNVTDFVQKNPTLVKAVTAFVGVIGLAVGGITAYVAITKIATIVSAAFTAAIPGLNIIMGIVAGVAALTAVVVALSEATKDETDALTSSSRAQHDELQALNEEYKNAKDQYGETSDEALALRYEVDQLTASYEANKQTLEEFVAENDALIESHNKVISSYSEATKSINDEEQGALALTYKLQELSKKTYLTTVEQEQMKAIVDALNKAIPNLALNYDKATNSLNMSAVSVEKMVKAQADQERQAENYRAWVDLTKEELTLSEQLAEAQKNLKLRREELTKEGYNVDAPLIGWSTDLDDYIKEVERLQTAYDENQTALEGVTEKAEAYAAAQKDTSDVTKELTEAISGVTAEMAELSAAYEKAYNAALESVSGQYSLWDEAAAVVATSADTINAALESQAKYWQNYNTNLANLSDRTADIEGLSEMIASFADGSEGSVNAIAGMASATDSELAAMVTNWQKLKKEQETVADSLAEMETDFTASMDALQLKLETSVSEMNLNDEAAESGKSTMQGFIKGAEGMLPYVKEAYARIAQAGIDAIDAKLEIHSPSRVMWNRAEMAWSGYIKATEAMEPDVKVAMAETAGAGVNAIATEAVSAKSGGNGTPIDLTVAPVYNFPGGSTAADIAAVLRDATEDLKDKVLSILEEAGIDSARRAYA